MGLDVFVHLFKQQVTCKPDCEGNERAEREREEGKPAALPLQAWGIPAAVAALCCTTQEKVALT